MGQIVLDIFTPILMLFLVVMVLSAMMATAALIVDFIRQSL